MCNKRTWDNAKRHLKDLEFEQTRNQNCKRRGTIKSIVVGELESINTKWINHFRRKQSHEPYAVKRTAPPLNHVSACGTWKLIWYGRINIFNLRLTHILLKDTTHQLLTIIILRKEVVGLGKATFETWEEN